MTTKNMQDMTDGQIRERIDMLYEEISANEDENWMMQKEIDELEKLLD